MKETVLQEAPSPQSPLFWKRFQKEISPHTPALVLDERGHICHLTPTGRSLLEYRPDQKIDARFFSHIHPNNLYQIMRDVADMVCYGRSKATWMLRLRTGRDRWRWYKAAVQNALGETPAAIVVTLREV